MAKLQKDSKLFRREALAKLSSPEQLDRALAVTSSRGWLALTAVLTIFVAVVGWSFLGRVPTYVQGNALLLNRGGQLVDAVSIGQVRLDTLEVAVGDEVAEGQVVAVGSNIELAERLANARAQAAELERALEEERQAVAEEGDSALANAARERQRLDEIEAAARASVETAEAILGDNLELYGEGVVPRPAVERSQQDLNLARRELLAVLRERDVLEASEERRENTDAARLREAEARLLAAQRQVGELEVMTRAGRIGAPVSGRVIEIKAATGTLLGPGQSVLSIRTGSDELEALIYIPPTGGPQVEAGMEVLVSPITIRREEFGSIRGVVESLSPFPVSFEGIVAELQNRDLASTFSEQGPPYSGRVTLLRDPETASGFAWTSPRASEETLTSGTLATVEIRTQQQRPITMVIPAIREFLGV